MNQIIEETKRILDQLACRIVKAHAASAILEPAERLSDELSNSVEVANDAFAKAGDQACELRTLIEQATERAAEVTSTNHNGTRVIADADERIRQLGGRIVRSHESAGVLRDNEERAVDAGWHLHEKTEVGEALRASLQTTLDQARSTSADLDESVAMARRTADELDSRLVEVDTQATGIVRRTTEELVEIETRFTETAHRATDALRTCSVETESRFAETCERLRAVIDAGEMRIRALAEAEARVDNLAKNLAQREVELDARAESATQRLVEADASADRLQAMLRQADERVARLTGAERSAAQAIRTWESGLPERSGELQELAKQADGIVQSVRSNIRRGKRAAFEASIGETCVPEARRAMKQFSDRVRVLQDTAAARITCPHQ